MALDPQYGSIPVVGSAVLSATADSSYTAPSNAVTLLSGQGPRQVTDGATNSNTTVTSASANFNSGDIGRSISGAGIPAGTVIASVQLATSVTISQPATATATGVTLTLGGGFGTKVEEIDCAGTGTTVAGFIEFFLYDQAYDTPDSASTYHHLPLSVQVTAVTPSTTVAPFSNIQKPPNLWLPPRWSLVATSWVASQLVSVTAFGENL